MIQYSGASIVGWGRKRIPPSYEIFHLFATIVFLVYGWTTFAFFWKLPSWLSILSLSEIAIIVAYILTSDLLESLLVLTMFLVVCILLPPRWLRDDLAVRGSALMYAFTFWACLFALNSLIGFPTWSETFLMLLGLLASIGVAVWLLKRKSILSGLIRSASERLTIFLYIWIPLSLFALVVVMIRFVGRFLRVL